MKQFFFFFFAMLASITASATVTVTPISTDYATQKVTFKVAWNSAPYNNRVWVWVDFCPITGTVPATSFSTATVSNPTITGGNGSTATPTARGFFIVYSSATNAGTTVTATLSNAPAGKFNWCAYGSDMPPNATVNTSGGYTLRGTSPFTINSSQTATSNFGAGTCITSITDLTGRPDGFATPALTISTTNPAVQCGAGEVNLNATASGGTTTSMSYTWKVGTASETTTPTNTYSPSVAVGSTTYSVTVTNANNCTSAAAIGTITVNAIPATPTGASANSRCGSGAVAFSATAASGCTIDWYNASSNGSIVSGGTGTASFALSITNSTTYYAQSRNTSTGCTSTSRLAVTGTIYNAPSISRSGGNASQTVTQNSAITAITYTATNASSITLSSGSFPNGLSYGWSSNKYVISGSPTAAGTFAYTVTTANANGCTNVSASGQITVGVLYPPGATTITSTCGTQTWSSYLRHAVSGCASTSSLSTSNPPPAQYYTHVSKYGYLYNWTCMNNNATILCPYPWHVPSTSELEYVRSCTSMMQAGPQMNWGGSGYMIGGTVYEYDWRGFMWAREQASSTKGWFLGWIDSGFLYDLYDRDKNYGISIKCVK
jgi:hypothetical protein